jgi:hypothetical protein
MSGSARVSRTASVHHAATTRTPSLGETIVRKPFSGFLLTLISPLSWGAVVYSNFGVGDTYNTGAAYAIGSPGNEYRRAVRFTPTFNGAFTSVRVPVLHLSGTNSYVVSLATDNAGIPGVDIETFSGVVFPVAASIVTLTSVASPPLLAGSSYWIVVRAPDPVVALGRWYANNQTLTGSYLYRLDTPVWEFQATSLMPAYEVNATGACGAANGVAGLVAPATNLCSAGAASAVTTTAANFTWTCTNASVVASCSAPRQFSVTTSAGAGGTLSCAPNPVVAGARPTCTATPNAALATQSISGCGGVATGAGVNTYTTGTITAACTVTATFMPVCSLDFSGDSLLDATDGLLLTRWLLGLRGEALVVGIALVPPSTTAAQFSAAVSTRMASLSVAVHDFDGNGTIGATTDALILSRILRDVRSDAAVAGALSTGATRRTYVSVRNHLNSVCAAGITP